MKKLGTMRSGRCHNQLQRLRDTEWSWQNWQRSGGKPARLIRYDPLHKDFPWNKNVSVEEERVWLHRVTKDDNIERNNIASNRWRQNSVYRSRTKFNQPASATLQEGAWYLRDEDTGEGRTVRELGWKPKAWHDALLNNQSLWRLAPGEDTKSRYPAWQDT